MTDTLFPENNTKMNTFDHCCSFCLDPGHNIRTCSDIRIENGWRDILRRSNIIRLLENNNDEDLRDVRVYLETFPELLLTAVAIKFAQSYASDSTQMKINAICWWIYREASRYETLSIEEKGAFLHWMDPDTYLPDGTIIPADDLPEVAVDSDSDLPDLISDDESDNGFIPLTPNVPVSHHLIEPILLCMESAEELGQYSECPICFEEDKTLLDMNTTSCDHSFCHSCIIRHLRRKVDCPMCRAPVRTLQVRQSEHYDAVMEAFGPIRRTSIPVNMTMNIPGVIERFINIIPGRRYVG